ncbi:MAG TPA: MFS transporter [Bryobacteraceae bacterium]|nr:MFS transporter [Bryobacteraceae bacterium]HOQ45221.1 MFS transporter [Bryobacteraceae bacterium]HPU71293.1 MFS transporter [Bryobacteraceae bacterium]
MFQTINPPGVRRAGRFSLFSLILLSAGHFSVDLYSGALGALQPLLVKRFGMSLAEAGLLGGLLVCSSSLMQPLYGYLSDRFHTRLFAALGPRIAGLFISSLGLAPSYGWLLLMVALGGAGIAAFHPQASVWATHGLEGKRGRAMAIFISAGTLGFACGPLCFSAVTGLFGLRGTIWAAIPGLLVCVLLIATLPEAGAHKPKTESGSDWRALRAVWKPLAILYSLVFIRSIVQVTYAQMIPLYLTLERGYSVGSASVTLSLFLAFGAFGGFVGGHLSDRFGGKPVIVVSMIASVPLLMLFFLTRGFVSAAGLLLGGLILLFTIPVNVVMAQDLVPSQAGTISALMMGFAWGSAGLVFIPLTGWMADVVSMHNALLALLVFPLIGFVLSLRLPK